MSSQSPQATHLVISASRGLGRALAEALVKRGHRVYGTLRTDPDEATSEGIRLFGPVDLLKQEAAQMVVDKLKSEKLGRIDTIWYVGGLLKPEDFDKLDWSGQQDMYTICCISPVFIIQALTKAGFLALGSKVVVFTSEGGSITLRTKEEGGGMFGHHGSKAAQNMITKLLSFDLKDKEVPVVALHPGFMKTEMTKGAGFDKFYENGGAVEPSEAAESMVDFVEQKVDMSKSGQFWAPRGPKDIGQAENVLGKGLSTPLEIPW